MKIPQSKLGWALSGGYVLISAYLILTQGLFGESFIAIILGLPWTLFLAFFEFFGLESSFAMYVLIFSPMILNAILLYLIGSRIGRNRETAI